MRRKRSQRWIAMLLAAAMLASTIESTGLAQTLHQETEEAAPVQQEEKRELELPERVKEWGEGYETIRTQEEADALRTADDSAKILVAAETCALAGLTFGELVSVDTATLNLSDLKGKLLCVEGNTAIDLYGTELEQLLIKTEKDETVTLHLDAETQIPEIILEGSGTVCIEGNGALGLVRAEDPLTQLTVRATCSVLNDSKESVKLVSTDGNTADLQPGEQKEIVLSSYLITFMADGQVYQTVEVKPGETIPFPEENPEKEGFMFTAWYKDETFTETCSQFAVAQGQTTLYARFVDDSEAVQVTFDSMGGRELEPQILAKGETLLSRSINEIYTEKEGYTFGGWCIDEECTTAFSYTEPLEEDITLYAFFVSEEMQETTKDGNIASLADFDWQDTIALRTDAEMTIKDVESNVQITAGTGEHTPEVTVEETENGYLLRGSYYEKNGSYGFEPGATFTVILSGGVHFADYPDETDTAVVSVYKDQVEVVGFSENMDYVLWDDVLEYVPVTMTEEEAADADAEEESETDKAEAESEELESEIDELSDQDGDAAEEQEQAAYIPGTILVKDTADYEIGDLIAFYDGEIGREEKSMDLYTEGSFDGYVLYAQILKTEKQKDGILLTYGYANPEDYLADFDVHISDDVNLENELNDTDVEVLTSRLSRQVEENEELKAQMLVSVMSAPETQDMLDEMYGEGVYALAAMTATLQPGKPTVKLSVSGSEVSAKISVSATATIKKDGKTMLTVKPTLAFTQSVGVTMNVDGGAVWIDMSVSVRSTSKIELTVTASTGRNTSVFSKAADTLAEIVKPEGIGEDDYESYDESVADLMDTMNSIVATSLKYNDLFDVLLLKLSYSFYGIITVSFEVHLVGQIGILATFGVEITATSGEKIGFKYNFLKFKGSSYTEKLESGVTSNIYLIGKVGARVGLRLVLSVTLCGIASASISGSVYAYAELTGLFFNTTNLLSGANTNLGALKFEVGIDVVVTLGLSVKLIIKTIRKNWTVYKGRWPLWSTSVSSKMSYMNGEKLDEMWAKSTANADNKTVFGFESIPMKTWDLMGGKCQENEQLYTKSGKFRLEIENLVVNGEAVSTDDPKQALFTVGDPAKNQNPGYIYMDEAVAGEELCEKAELDVVLTYEDKASSAIVKKQTQRFHLQKECAMSTTTHNVKIVLQDWCAKKWGLETAAWNNAVVYETAFTSSHMLGTACEPTATGTLNMGEIVAAAQSVYPELSQYQYQWTEPGTTEAVMQYSVPQISNFCYMTPANGVVRYDVRPYTDSYEATYYLYVRRFEGDSDAIRYHIRMNGGNEENTYEFSVKPSVYDKELFFTKMEDGTYLLEASRKQFDGIDQSIHLSINSGEAIKTGFFLNGREYQQDVFFDITLGKYMFGIQTGTGVKGYQFVDPSVMTETGIEVGTKVELMVELEEGYGALEAVSENKDIDFHIEDNIISFVMPPKDLSIVLQAYKMYRITYEYHYGGYGVYDTVYFAENANTAKIEDPEIEGLTFRGWYTSLDGSGEQYQFGNKLETDITLYADWTCDVTVHFGRVKGKAAYWTGKEENLEEHLIFENDSNLYYQFTYSTLRVGEKIQNLQLPEYEGYQFMGWYTDSEYKGTPIDLTAYTLSGGVHLYAKWAKLLTVSFERNDSTENGVIQEMVAYENEPLIYLPEIPQREHYEFTGWYRNHAATDAFDTEKDLVKTDMTLYAGWKAIDYTITYELSGGENVADNPATYTTEDSFRLKEPTRKGYVFEGWTGTDLEDLTRDAAVAAGSGGDRTYTAKWEPVEYQIAYEKVYDSAVNNPVIYTIENEDIILQNPEREKYEFKGWIGTDLDQPTMEVRIPKGSTGDRTYTATWETTVAGLKILDRVEQLAEESGYEWNIIDALEQIGVRIKEKDQRISEEEYLKLDECIKSIAVEHIQDLIQNDGVQGSYTADEIGAYADKIQVQILGASVNRTGNTTQQIYTCQIKVIFNDENEDTYERIVNLKVYLRKIIPTLTAPTASNIKLRETVGQSILQGGKAEAAELLNQEVAGSFAWSTAEINKIPYGYYNGTNKYTVVFAPEQLDLYAVAETEAEILTQVELAVAIEADSRTYLYDEENKTGDNRATGKASLVFADSSGNIPQDPIAFTEVEGLLSGGTWYFENGTPEKDKTVTYSGYTWNSVSAINTAYSEEIPYYVLNTTNTVALTTTAEITAATLDDVTITTPLTDQEYGITMEKISLTGFSVTYQNGKNAEEIPLKLEGSWEWTCDLNDVPEVGESRTAKFTPAAKYQGGFGTSYSVSVKLNLYRKKVWVNDLPMTESYNGQHQKAVFPNDAPYEVVENNGGTNAGTYPVRLKLKNPTSYQWWRENANSSQTGLSGSEYSYNFTIEKAAPTLTEGNVQPINYGQKLTAGEDKKAEVNGVKDILTKYSAQTLLTGYSVRYSTVSDTAIAGTWSWVTETNTQGEDLVTIKKDGNETQCVQPLDAGTYQIKVKFTPSTNQDNLAECVTFVTLKVNKSQPYVGGCTLTASLYQNDSFDNQLGNAAIQATGSAKNQYTGQMVSGSWQWVDPNIKPNTTKTYQAKFVAGDTSNYTSDATCNCSVTVCKIKYTCNVTITYDGDKTHNATYSATWTPYEGNLQINLTKRPESNGGKWMYLSSTSVKYKTLNQESVDVTLTSDDGVSATSGSFSCLITNKTNAGGKCLVEYSLDTNYKPGTDIEISLNIKMDSQIADISTLTAYALQDSSAEIEVSNTSETEPLTKPVTAEPSTESQTTPPQSESQTEVTEKPTEPSTENQTSPPQSESQTEVTEKPTEPSTENQTSPPQSEPQTEVTEKATEASTGGQTPPPQTETEPPATEPPVTEAVTEKQSETTAPQTAAQTSQPETPAAQSESADPAEGSQNLPAETVPE